MSDNSSQDKTEQPSYQKLRKAREEGNLPRSRELVTATLILGSAILLGAFSGDFLTMAIQLSELNFSFDRNSAFESSAMMSHLVQSVLLMLTALTPPLFLMIGIAIASNLIRGGWNISTKAMQPKLSKLNPISGIKRMFSAKSLVELLKSILKVSLVSITLYLFISHYLDHIMLMQRFALDIAMAQSINILLSGLLSFGLALLVIAFIDLPYSGWDYTKQLKMTKQEVKDEGKNTEGNPEIKGRIRQMQRQMSQRRMLSTVPQADVIITNPTHFAVALKYDLSKAKAPFVIAKAVDHAALQMRSIGQKHEVPILEVPPLTRAIYYSTNELQEIPAPLYVAVAHILTFVFQMEQYRHGRQATKPDFPRISIPPELQR